MRRVDLIRIKATAAARFMPMSILSLLNSNERDKKVIVEKINDILTYLTIKDIVNDNKEEKENVYFSINEYKFICDFTNLNNFQLKDNSWIFIKPIDEDNNELIIGDKSLYSTIFCSINNNNFKRLERNHSYAWRDIK